MESKMRNIIRALRKFPNSKFNELLSKAKLVAISISIFAINALATLFKMPWVCIEYAGT